MTGKGVLGDDQGGTAQVHQAESGRGRRGHRAEAAAERLGGLVVLAQAAAPGTVTGEDEDIGQTVAVDVERIQPGGRAGEAGECSTASVLPQAKAEKLPEASRFSA